MKRQQMWLAIAAGSVALTGSVWLVQAQRKPQVETQTYLQTIRETADMVNDSEAQAMARRLGLNILNLTWEDTGRYKNSSVGPNISDMTIQVGAEDPNSRQLRVTCMPVIRYPNFSDKTCDLDPRDFTLLVGNQDGCTFAPSYSVMRPVLPSVTRLPTDSLRA